MSLVIQKELLRRFLEKMYGEGMINNQFGELQELKEATRPDFVVRAITLYCMAAKNLFSLLSNLLDQTEVDFYQVAVHAHELFERSSSIGAEHVKIASADIGQSSQASDKKHCIQALNQTKKEFSKLRRNLETLVQMERKIIDLENGNEVKWLSTLGQDSKEDHGRSSQTAAVTKTSRHKYPYNHPQQ